MKINHLSVLSLLMFFAVVSFSACDDDEPEVCDTSDVSFSAVILPIVEQNCFTGCHNGSNPTAGFALETYEQIKNSVDLGGFLGSIRHEEGFTAMPLNKDPLPDCDISKIAAWIDQGALDN